ncbi:response regulator [Catenovulum agarivorans DS-2]|uniref:Response regulator n=1 Tax=Catenovulum agarivorans DS-2 TaxID=1328313 RepID=W7QT70_9ALTE|nr:DUF3369 domain-containing protein [Catenovulum agarivorans]EWH12232.1 response regulator [Catenovulum agarivorans DS-2]
MNDDFLFTDDDTTTEEETSYQKTWKVLIVDDEPEVHAVTKLALSDFTFQHHSLEFISAYSGAEAKELIVEHPDTAIILLDVVMETDDAGLRVAEFIRQEANNQFVRIILRTGQPGQAPERHVIVNYDINDYKSKTELTAQKLFTVIMASLRSYRDIMSIEKNRMGLETIIKASANLFSNHSMDTFINGILRQLTSIINCTNEAMYVTSLVADDHLVDGELVVVTGQGEFADLEGKKVFEVIQPNMKDAFEDAINDKDIVYGDDFIVAYCESHSNHRALLYIANISEELSATDKHLIELFTKNVQIAYDNVILTQDIEDTQREIVMRLSESVECRSEETGNHVKRVAAYCRLFAEHLGLPEEETDNLVLASPLHDVGKIGIPDRILNKQGPLTPDEMTIMRKHSSMGYHILAGSERPIIKAGALIARDHHERWDGTGYPEGKKGKEIHLYGRIVSIADVYDALRSKRCYKEAWSPEQTMAEIKSQSGKHFDPELVDIFIDKYQLFEEVLQQYPD